MGLDRSPRQLAKFFAYVLGRAPHEFGLVPDSEGFFKIREFLKALHQEPGYGFVRESHINEVSISVPNPPILVEDKSIRAVDRNHLPRFETALTPPKLLYTCVRKRAHVHAMEKGIRPTGHPRIILTPSEAMAIRIGERFDRDPVLLTVQSTMAMDSGVVFESFGENIFLADRIPAGCFTGPPVPKEPEPKKKEQASKAPEMKTPGTYIADITPQKTKKKKGYRKRDKDIAWKKERKRKQKESDKW